MACNRLGAVSHTHPTKGTTIIIADLTNQDTGKPMGRVYLADAPFPGDVIETVPPVTVLRRSFLDLGPDGDPAGRLSLNLKVRPL